MSYITRHSKAIAMVLCLSLIFQLTSCGMLLYPERRGQDGGKIDPVVAVLDGVGLLFFLIPGIVAFGVDIGTGTIYLPPGGRADATPDEDSEKADDSLQVVQIDPDTVDQEAIEEAVEDATGIKVSLADPRMEVTKYPSTRLLQQEVAYAGIGLHHAQRADQEQVQVGQDRN